ncbi:A24 family peptidase [Nocardia yamanashiensis]|uniref:A24 family peptidase n=1 Tax=Nocardia yamanashiensis TaxID=209247 RepID=UPI001E38CE45|nr:A24 family peptidase [Nocardia yamanashiensis]UGT43047.1 A24 family peptidase [Nocardia yamanashiensis]
MPPATSTPDLRAALGPAAELSSLTTTLGNPATAVGDSATLLGQLSPAVGSMLTTLGPSVAAIVWCVVLIRADLCERRLPNALTIPGAVVVLAYATGSGRLGVALVGALLLALPYLVVHLAAPGALGAGDVKLAMGLGAVTALGGAQCWVRAALGAPALTAIGGVVVLVVRCVRASDNSSLSRDTHRAGWLQDVISVTRTGSARDAGVNPGGGVRVCAGAETNSGVPSTSRPPGSGAGGHRGGTLPHGPGMCVASLLALALAP